VKSQASTLEPFLNYPIYKTGGKKALKVQKRGRPEGSCRTLSIAQEKEIQKVLIDKDPERALRD
jgi:hypothetical protein